jgi:hypothetical protein
MNTTGRYHGKDPSNPYPQYLRISLLPTTPESGASKNKWYRLAYIQSTSRNRVSSWYFGEMELFSGQNKTHASYAKFTLRVLYDSSGQSSAELTYDEADFIGISTDNIKVIQTSDEELNRQYEVWFRAPLSWQAVSVRVNFEHFYHAGIVFDAHTERDAEPLSPIPLEVTWRNRSGMLVVPSVNQLPAASEKYRGKFALVERHDGVAEQFSLYINGIAKKNGTFTIRLDDVPYSIPLTTADNTWASVYNKIKSVSYAGWTLTERPNQTTLIFTAKAKGPRNVTVDAGNTGVTYTLTTIAKGAPPSDDVLYVCKKRHDSSYAWVAIG